MRKNKENEKKIVNNCFRRSDVSRCEQSERGLPCETMRHKSRREKAAECTEAEDATMFQESVQNAEFIIEIFNKTKAQSAKKDEKSRPFLFYMRFY